MAWMRCALTGGIYRPWSWGDLKEGRRPELAAKETWVLSLVPTQLQRLLERPEAVAWLRRFEIIFVGGGPVWPELVEAAARAQLPLSLSYGMTETAAMVTALRPGEFLAGERSSGTALPHARVTVNADGGVEVAGASVYRGYYPAWSDARELRTEDLGMMDAAGRLTVLGRRDAIINTGGEKVRPEEVEQALRASGEFSDVAVVGVPDAEWGQAVVACYPAGGRGPDLGRAVVALAGPMKPKRFVAIADWPRNAQGKLNRAALRVLAGAGDGHPG
jgi:O-succinylbenzoic acid--CoA ligase